MAVRMDFDVLIAGGGTVGAALALALMTQSRALELGLRVALVEPQPPPAETALDVGLRVSALSPGSRHFLTHLDAWPSADRRGPQAYQRMQVEDASGRGYVDFNAHEYGLSALGWITDNYQLRACLWQRLRALEVALFAGLSIQSLQQRRRGLSCQLSDGRELRVGLLAAADGANSPLRQQLDIAVTERDYQQQAVVATVATERANLDTAWQRYLATGPLAFLPVSEGRSSIVWSLPSEEALAHVRMGDEAFRLALGAASQFKFGQITRVSERAAFPLRMMLAQRYVAGRAVLVGDAAHRIHPQAGLGLNLGLQDAAALAELLVLGLADNAELLNDDIALPRLLRRYERWRRSEDEVIVRGVDAIGRLMLGEGVLSKTAGLGFSLVNRLAPLKEIFLRQACGLGKDAPKAFRHPPDLSAAAPVPTRSDRTRTQQRPKWP